MASGSTRRALRELQTLFELGTLGGMTDAQLLERFLARSDDAEDAFAALVHRHGPMVLGVCRRMLPSAHDAEDAFQATFLILARRAAAIGRRERLANWLYGVAVRVAKEARRRAARRQARERRAMDGTRAESESEQPGGEWDDLLPILDEELSRLPDRYRTAMVACELEGKSRSEAAHQLGIPEGTLSTHLARGRKLLRERLVRRGVSLGALAALPRGAAEAAVPERLFQSTVQAAIEQASGAVASGTVSATVTALAEGVLKMMVFTRLTVLVAAVMALSAAGLGAYAAWAAVPPRPTDPPEVQADNPASNDRTDPAKAPRRARVHGMVVDEAGKPVPGIEVRIMNHDDHQSRGVTDSAGRFDFAIRSPLLRGAILLAGTADQSRQGIYAYDYTVDETETKQPVRIVLKPSREVVVRVTDPARTPVPGAAVEVVAGYRMIAVGSADDRGTVSFRIPVDANVQWIIALKSGRGFDYFEHGRDQQGAKGKELPGTVTLVLDGARTARIRAVDSAGKPLARIGFAPWYFQKPGKRAMANIGGGQIVKVETDARGIATFDWLPATTSPVVFFPRSEGYYAPLRTTLEKEAADTTLTARLLREETIRGRVVGPDGKPAAGILVLAQGCGPEFANGRGQVRTASDGSYEMTVESDQAYAVTVSDNEWAAPSHLGVVVREGRPVAGLDFHLERGTLIHGSVTIGPDRKPAAGRSIWLHQSGGELPKELRGDDRFYHEVAMDRHATTGADGRFHLRVGPGTYTLGISGEIVPETILIKNEPELIHDLRMARQERGPISGRVVLAGQPNRGVAGAKIEGIVAEPTQNEDLNVVADAEGRFRAERALKRMVVHAKSPDGSLGAIVEISGDGAEVVIPLGPTATASGIVLDERGNPQANTVLFWGRRVHMGDENAPWRTAFSTKATTDEDGRFVLPELVVGQPYDISVPIRKANAKDPDGWNSVGAVLPEKAAAIDLGTLQVGVTGRNGIASSFRDGGPNVGDLAPGFEAGAQSHGARTLDGRPLRLEDFRGKFVLLDFWATWCGPCVAEIPHLQAVYEAFGRDPRFVMLSLSVDEAIDAPRQFQAKRKLPWIQGFLGQGIHGAISDKYGVEAVPALVLIGPDGKIVARGMRGEEIRKTVARALGKS
jgi:RNA polymerase sigma factor (sigma-70 family)